MADALERAAADAGVAHLVSARGDHAVALLQGRVGPPCVRAGIGRPIDTIAGVPRAFRDAQLAVERVREGQLAYEDFDLATLLLSEVAPEHIRPRVEDPQPPRRPG